MPCSVAQSCQLFVTPWTVAHQSPLSMGFSTQEYWSGSRESSQPRDWTWVSCTAGGFFTTWATREAWVELWVAFFFFLPCCRAGRISVPGPGIEPMPLQWRHRILTTGLPGKAPIGRILKIFSESSKFHCHRPFVPYFLWYHFLDLFLFLIPLSLFPLKYLVFLRIFLFACIFLMLFVSLR